MHNLASIFKNEILNSNSPGSRKTLHESALMERWVDRFIKRQTVSLHQRK